MNSGRLSAHKRKEELIDCLDLAERLRQLPLSALTDRLTGQWESRPRWLMFRRANGETRTREKRGGNGWGLSSFCFFPPWRHTAGFLTTAPRRTQHHCKERRLAPNERRTFSVPHEKWKLITLIYISSYKCQKSRHRSCCWPVLLKKNYKQINFLLSFKQFTFL